MSPTRILLVDDDASFRTLVTTLLAANGLEVVAASTGAEGSRRLAEGHFDLIIVDGLLPDTSGLGWLEALRARGDATPVIFCSAFWRDLSSSRRLTRELGVRQVVHKPVVPEMFVQQVRDELSPAAPPTPPTEAPATLPADIAAAVAWLRHEFLVELPERVDELLRAVKLARKGEAGALSDARDMAHRLVGTAGSYGFDKIAELAREAEHGLMALLDNPAATDRWEGIQGAVERARVQVEAETAPQQEPSRPKVLFVGKDPVARAAFEATGQRQLFDVSLAETAAEALQHARLRPPDVAILDASLPGPVDAFGLAGALRGQSADGALPLAILSDDSSVERRVAAAHAGANLFLTKPVVGEALGTALRQLLTLERAGRPKVLVVDDDPAFVALTQAVLRREGVDVAVERDPARILERLDAERPDALLLDMLMPGLTGADICRMLRAAPRWQDLPILCITAHASTAQRQAAFRAGADDFIEKPIVTEELVSRVRVRVERAQLLRERTERDSLTGLLQRRPFLDQLATRLAEAQRHNRPLALAILDVDHFKRINDERGHAVGDRVLSGLGRLLGSRFRGEDLRCRWGGEEFALAFPGESREVTQGVIDRVRFEFAGMIFEGDDGVRFSATFSGGIATFPSEGANAESLIVRADARLYLAKRRGRNRVEIEDPPEG